MATKMNFSKISQERYNSIKTIKIKTSAPFKSTNIQNSQKELKYSWRFSTKELFHSILLVDSKWEDH